MNVTTNQTLATITRINHRVRKEGGDYSFADLIGPARTLFNKNNMELIVTIRAEIENWLKEYAEDSQFELGERHGYKRVLSLLDTLESKKPMNLDGLDEEIIRFNMVNRPINHSELGLKQWGEMVARHFAQWGAENLKK